MSLKHSAGLAEALHHAFVRPLSSLTQSRAVCIRSRPTIPLRSSGLPLHQTRSFTPRNPNKYRPPEGDAYNEMIQPVRGQIDLANGSEGLRRVRIRPILQDLDRKTERLVQVAGPDAPGSRGVPICKIVSTKHQFEREYFVTENKKLKDMNASMKKLELNWSVEPKDITHRLKAMKKFLEEGRAVEIEFLVNKRGRKVDLPERRELVNMVEEAVSEVKNVQMWKQPEGKIESSYRISYVQTKATRAASIAGPQKETAEKERQSKKSQEKQAQEEKATENETRRQKHLEEERQMQLAFEKQKADEAKRREELKRMEEQAREEEERQTREAEELLKRL